MSTHTSCVLHVTYIVIFFQVSHHPPVSALRATHEKENIDVTWIQHFIPKFRGMLILDLYARL